MRDQPDTTSDKADILKDGKRTNVILRVVILTFAACFVFAMNSGIRNNYGIMLRSIVTSSGISFASVSFILAVGQLVFGVVQPGFGILAAKKGSIYALISGFVLTMSGMLLIPYCRTPLALMICLGFVLPAGSGAIYYGVMMGAITPKIPPASLSTVSGVVNASSGVGNTIMSPIINSLIRSGGLLQAMLVLAVPMLLTLPASLFLSMKERRPESKATRSAAQTLPTLVKIRPENMIRNALHHKIYIILMIGFFTCGFHMALIMTHLPTQIQAYGFSSQVAANAFSVYGITSIVGSLLSGSLCNRFRLKNVLAFYYGLRPVTILGFLLIPKTVMTMTIFTALLGFSGVATIPPVAGMINKHFGAKNIATLFGLVFLIHQIGGFFGAWLGGISFDVANSYNLIWGISIALSTLASVISFAIKD